MDKKELQLAAVKVRKGIVTAVHAAKAGHPGGSLSAADIFTYLYFKEMNIDPKDPRKADRDRFVLSKGTQLPVFIRLWPTGDTSLWRSWRLSESWDPGFRVTRT